MNCVSYSRPKVVDIYYKDKCLLSKDLIIHWCQITHGDNNIVVSGWLYSEMPIRKINEWCNDTTYKHFLGNNHDMIVFDAKNGEIITHLSIP